MNRQNALLILFSFLLLTLLSQNSKGQQKKRGTDIHQNLKLWYSKPASIWEEALPLGNGKLGAMVFGGVGLERLQLNDNTLWSGAPDPGNLQGPGGPAQLEAVRKLVFMGQYDSATALWQSGLQGPYSARYLPMADLWLKKPESSDREPDYQNYYRDLNLKDATASVSYTESGVHYKREALISYPDQVLALHIKADKKGAVNLDIGLTSPLKYRVQVPANMSGSAKAAVSLLLRGKAPKYVANRAYEKQQVVYDDWDGEGTNFEVLLTGKVKDGSLTAQDSILQVRGATEFTLYLTSATSFNGFDKSPGKNGRDPHAAVLAQLARATVYSFDQLKDRHEKDYQQLFNRVSFQLADHSENQALPTGERLKAFRQHPDDYGLQTLYYQYGRYLLIAASRAGYDYGSRPANLQGIWNHEVQPPWGSNYTTNINTEMNYWLAENTNLSACHEPLFSFIRELSVNGAVTARQNYGIREGWVAHHNSDIWAKTSPPGGQGWKDPGAHARWSCWPMAGAWLSTHLWEHYLYTGNKAFLKDTAYPLMAGAARFMLAWLVKDPKTGYLVTNPSTSPENTMKVGDKEYEISMATTMDMSIIRELFTDVIRAGEQLGTDSAFTGRLKEASARLYPYHIGQYGQLQEWFQDYDDPKDQHRHLSHLFGLYPGSQITLSRTPELAAAAKKSLIFRGDISTGWSMAWKANWWARLHDAAHAYKILSDAFHFIDPHAPKGQMSGGGTYPNLFDAHPPFQIDGNFGATAAMTEMLLQSHEGYLFLLPALPSQWAAGKITGIKARGNFEISIRWESHQLSEARIYSQGGGPCRLHTLTPVKILESPYQTARGPLNNPLLAPYGTPPYERHNKEPLEAVNKQAGYTIDFQTEKGKTYTVVPL